MREALPILQLAAPNSGFPVHIPRLVGDTPRSGPAGSQVGCELIQGDNLDALRCLVSERAGQVTLAYLDPPFFTGRAHHKVDRQRTSSGIERSSQLAFDDRWESLSHYLLALKLRLTLVHELLSPTGSVVIHVDPKTSHYIKVMCDEIFGMDCFASEVIWRYRRWPSKTKNFQRVHDVMLRYVKSTEHAARFNQLYEPLAPSTQKTWGDRKQRAVVGADGRRVRSSSTQELSHGVPLGDVWEIPIVAPVARERNGYPTQKPEALMKRWIEACSDPDDLILDPYMGSGTTVKVALELGRRVIGIDAGEQAHSVTQARLDEQQLPYHLRQVEISEAARVASVKRSPGVKKSQHRSASSLSETAQPTHAAVG